MIKIAPLVAEEIKSKDLYVARSAFYYYIYIGSPQPSGAPHRSDTFVRSDVFGQLWQLFSGIKQYLIKNPR